LGGKPRIERSGCLSQQNSGGRGEKSTEEKGGRICGGTQLDPISTMRRKNWREKGESRQWSTLKKKSFPAQPSKFKRISLAVGETGEGSWWGDPPGGEKENVVGA